MKKKLFRAAFISSPIIGIIGSTPLYIIDKISIPNIIILWLFLSFIVFAFWIINIVIITKVKETNSVKRYLLSFLLTLIFQLINISIIFLLEIKLVPRNVDFYPLVPAIGINTIIIILSNSIILQFQKRNAELEIERLKVNNLEAQRLMLLQQLQPHFLFNALSTLKSLISEDPSKAEDYTIRLSEFLRYSFQAKNNELVLLADSIKFTEDYVELQKVRFGDSFDCKIEIPEVELQKKVPIYAVQTLVENAIKHNAFNDKKPLFIQILIDEGRLKVKNNLIPKKDKTNSGTGLENLNQRYKMIANLEIEVIKTEKSFTVFINLI
jgi:two-component system LytT family sensor kinase